MKDFMGVELQPGDYVAYGVRRGNTGDLRVGIILEIYDPPPGAPRAYSRGNAKVRGCEPGWRDGEPFSFSKVTGRLTDGTRVIKLHPAMVRREIIDGLKGPEKESK